MKKWDEKLADLSTDLDRLSKKASDASEDAKAARELRQEAINDRIGTARGNVIAFQEKMRIAGEERKSRLFSALLKVQMTAEERARQRREEKDKRHLEKYIDEQINSISENFETASYLISDAQLAILETIKAIDEYSEKYGAGEADEADGTDEADGAEEADGADEADETDGADEAGEGE